MLYKVFVDESGKKEYITPYAKDFIDNPPEFERYENFWWDNYFVLCGIRIKQEHLGKINFKINKLKEKYFKTQKVEIKSDWLRNPYQRKKQYINPYKISPEKLNEFGEKFINLIASYKNELKIITVVFDKRYYGNAKRQTPEGDPLLKSTQVLLERLEFAGKYNILIFDQMESSLKLTIGKQGKILNVFKSNEGMEKIFVEKYGSMADIKFMESKKENFLQAADICAYNIFRQFVQFGREWGGSRKTKDGSVKMYTYSYFDRIRCNFYFSLLTKQVRGYGLTCIPDTQKINWNLLKGCFSHKKSPHK